MATVFAYNPGMRPSHALRHWLTASAPLLLVLLALALCFGTEAGIADHFKLYRAAHPALTWFMQAASDWTGYAFYAWFLWLLFDAFRRGDARQKRFVMIFALAQIAVALVLVRVLKMAIGRPRPGEDGSFQAMTAKPAFHSLPSGHTTEASGAALSLALNHRRLLLDLGLGLVVALLGFSRIYLGWHHPLDVLCGWMLGSVTGLAVTLFAPGPAPDGDGS